MALTEIQKMHVRRFLGYPNQTPYNNFVLDSLLADMSEVTEDQVIEYLDNLMALETHMYNNWQNLVADKVEDIKLSGITGILAYRAEGWRIVCALASLLGVVPATNIFQTHRSKVCLTG